MTKDNRRVITWTHIESSQNYRNSIKKYSHKIYSIGIHEFGVRSNGKIYDYTSGQDYFDANGNHTGIRFPVVIEQDMIDYPSIKWYLQAICFGWGTVRPFLDNNVKNSEGRYPQDQFIYEMGKILDLYSKSRNTGTPLTITGVEMDVEASMASDPQSQGYDVKYIRFLEKLKNELLIPRGLKLRVNAHAMWGENVPYYYRFHNYKLFAESVDRNGNATIDEIQLMTYDFAWSGSAAGASTPIWWFRNVAEWCKKNFDPSVNPKAKLTIDNLYFGSAGYGHRWGMHDQEVVKSGTNITYHNLLGWQNGLYKHYHTEKDDNGQTIYVYHDQEYLPQVSFQDEESKNEVMYPHVYDFFKPKYVKIFTQDGGNRTATVGTYNRLDYATTYFKQQIPKWKGVKAIATVPSSVSGKAFAVVPQKSGLNQNNPEHYPELRKYDPNLDPDSPNFKHLIKTVDGEDKVFVGYYTVNRLYFPNSSGTACVLEPEPEGRINYTVNIPSAGNYRLIALTSFSWYEQAKLGGYVNGNQRFTVGGDNLPEWYPFFLKGAHWFDCGTFSFDAGTNTIEIQGELSAQRTIIYGFVVCEDFDQNFSGGILTCPTNIVPFLKKDGTPADIPEKFALAAKMLRRDARPAILWDDEFRTYEEGQEISAMTYYRKASQDYKIAGGGTNLEKNEKGEWVCYSDAMAVGYSQGYWTQQDDGTGRQCLYFNSDAEQNPAKSGQLVLSKQWSVNLYIEARLKIVKGANAGIRFHAQSRGTVADGYIFRLDFQRGVRELVYEDYSTGESKTIASQPLGNVFYGVPFDLKVVTKDNKARFFVGDVQAFVEAEGNPVTHDGSVDVTTGEVTLERTSGACGIYANNVELYCYHLGIGTIDRWETMEKFEIEIDGQVREFGRIKRTGYEYDEFGYLIFSGFDETVTRDPDQSPFEEDAKAVSLDYEVTVLDWDGWQGAKDIKIRLVDAGVWFGELLVGDKEGMSVIWAGDAWSFLDVMNIAVNDYGAKGIGLWAMGQEDPRIWELIPDVVPKTHNRG